MNFRKIGILLVLLAGVLILYPAYNVQLGLTQGDNGRDFYCFKETFDGALPYRDYWWVYGPLMPFYYGFFYKFFGVNISSVLFGKMALNLLSGLLVYLSLSMYTSAVIAVLAALWLWIFGPDFTYTYNHIGGIFLMLSVVYFMFLYIKDARRRFIWAGAFLCFLLSLVKINIGFSTLAGFLGLVLLKEAREKTLNTQKKKAIFYSGALAAAASGLAYGLLIYDLPLYYIRQCFPYLKSDHPINVTILESFKMLWNAFFYNSTSSLPNLFFGLTVFLCAVKGLLDSRQKTGERKLWVPLLAALVFLSALNMHEFFASGIYYRIFWISPLIIMLHFMIIFIGTRDFSRVIKYSVYLVLFILVSLQGLEKHRLLKAYQIPPQYLAFEAGKAYVTNPPEWMDTVIKTTRYLQSRLKKEESFLALPYDPLYYFLAGKESPVRELNFFEHINIKEGQQRDIIRRLEEKNTNWIVLSSRSNSPVRGLGEFGKDYGIVLSEYIKDHFELVETFGDWQTPPRKAFEHHGVKIFRRITPL